MISRNTTSIIGVRFRAGSSTVWVLSGIEDLTVGVPPSGGPLCECV
jgi:hypothetical protein